MKLRAQNSNFLMEEVDHSVREANKVVTNTTISQSKQKANFNGTPHIKSLSSRQLESLLSICDTFLPSINISGDITVHDSVRTFYKTCASMAGTHQHVGVMIGETLKHPSVPLLRLSLWLLSTRLGTSLLCGTLCLSTKFPYFHKFSELPQKKREKIFRSWALSFFYPLRKLFKTLKYLTMLAFFSKVLLLSHSLSLSLPVCSCFRLCVFHEWVGGEGGGGGKLACLAAIRVGWA
ncbi:long-chain-alcohol oxidase FAO4A-like [Macadamia integrifolia]|uniref:long-chain-alcohol oxidase FAO4A-like n=1 Tax=Macadamia integrifolia TaxID=60698 RepID=UPI001C53291E|nr:long-chain-alcohol oxidase FAO4A-like [Macadamia integrifolia]